MGINQELGSGCALHRISRALRARNPGRVRKECGAGPPVPKECTPESQQSPESQVLDSLRTLLRLRGALCRDTGGPAPGHSFGTLFGLFEGSGPEGSRRPQLCGAGPILNQEPESQYMGGFKRGCFPIWARPSRIPTKSCHFCQISVFCDFSGFF